MLAMFLKPPKEHCTFHYGIKVVQFLKHNQHSNRRQASHMS